MDDHRVKVMWRRIIALRLRALTGWGLNTPDLRRWARFYMIQAASALALMVLVPAYAIVMYNVLPRFGIGGSRIVPIRFILRPSLPLIIYLLFFLLLAALSFLRSVLHLRRARAGADEPLATYYGICFATAHALRHSFFALIGPSRETAQWFALPISWDTAFEPGGNQFEVTYKTATGFVEQVKRLGAEASSSTQPQESYAARNSPQAAREAANAGDGEATREQRRDIMRMFRRAGAHWGTTTGSMFALGLTTFICAIVCEAAPVVMILTTGVLSGHSHRSDFQTVVIASAIMAVVGVGCFLYGVHIMRIWARYRRSDALNPTTFHGNLLCWTQRGTRYGQEGDVLALAQAQDGARVVFRVPHKWQHRVWQGAGPIQVIYNPVSGCVLDYRPLPPLPAPDLFPPSSPLP